MAILSPAEHYREACLLLDADCEYPRDCEPLDTGECTHTEPALRRAHIHAILATAPAEVAATAKALDDQET